MPLFPEANYKKYTPQGPITPIIYPLTKRFFPSVFLKIEFFSRNYKEFKKGPLQVMYLPLPDDGSDFLMHTLQIQYSGFSDVGTEGEFIIRNYNAVSDSLSRVLGAGSIKEELGNAAESIGKEAYSFVKTYIERASMSSDEIYAKAVKQGLGYGFSPNKVLMFEQMGSLGEKSLQFNFSPKSVDEGRTIQTILKEFKKASLPKIEDEALEKVISTVVESVYEIAFNESDPRTIDPYPEDEVDSLSTMDNVNRAIERIKNDGDLFDNLGYMTDSISFSSKKKIKDVIRDVTNYFNDQQYFSSTFELPNSLRLSIMKREGNEDVEAVELVRFPILFVIKSVVSMADQGRDNTEILPFMKFEDENGSEYFSASYRLVVQLIPERVITAEDIVDHSQTPSQIKQNEVFKTFGVSRQQSFN